jgi:two-component system, LytTR family, response regulator
MTMLIVLADDEVLARQKLRLLLKEEEDCEIAGEAASAEETVELVAATRPDLIFLDIRMPGMDGFDVIYQLSSRLDLQMPGVIFTTAYDQYAVRAFEVHAVDYLLKPFTAERLRVALRRFRERAAHGTEARPREITEAACISRLVFRSRGRILFLPVSEIRLISAEENYVRLSTADGTHLLRETMSGLEDQLDPQSFLRIHRSFIVNLQYVKEIRMESAGDATAILINGEHVPVSRGYRSRLQQLLNR